MDPNILWELLAPSTQSASILLLGWVAWSAMTSMLGQGYELRDTAGRGEPRHGFAGLVAALALLPAALLGSSSPASAETYPSKPIKLIVPYPVGGAADIRARFYGQRLTEQLGQPVIVENRPGATGAIAAEAVARALPDGYTILFGTIQELVFNSAFGGSQRYDPLRDFAPISLAAAGYPFLLVHPSLGVRSLGELIALAKSKPGELSCGTAGHVSVQHFGCAYFGKLAGLNIHNIHYKGSGPALLDTSTGQVQVTIGFVSESQQYIRAGKLVPLAVLGPSRVDGFVDVPTMAEAGFEGMEILAWNSFLAPAGTPPDVVQRLNVEIAKAAKRPDAVEWFAKTNSVFIVFTPEEFGQFIRSETAKWRKIAAETGIKAAD